MKNTYSIEAKIANLQRGPENCNKIRKAAEKKPNLTRVFARRALTISVVRQAAQLLPAVPAMPSIAPNLQIPMTQESPPRTISLLIGENRFENNDACRFRADPTCSSDDMIQTKS